MKNILILSIILLFNGFAINSLAGKSNQSKQSEIKVMIDLSPNQPVKKLFPLTILSINGKSVVNKQHVMWLKPGKYQLKFLANVDLNYLNRNNKIIQSKINLRKWHDGLDLEVEANNVYHLAFDASARKVEDWKPVVLKVVSKHEPK